MIEAVMFWNEPNNKSHWDPQIDPDWKLYAETVIAAYRSTETGEPARRVFTPSTRALPPAVEAALRATGWLRR